MYVAVETNHQITKYAAEIKLTRLFVYEQGKPTRQKPHLVILFQPKKKKKKNLFYHQRTKKSYVIGEAKAKFFATIVNWYKYQSTIASC